MQYLSLSPRAGLLLLNVAAASVVIGLAGITMALLVRRLSLSLRHGLLCVALVLTMASPLPVWIAGNLGLGIVPVTIPSSDRHTSDDAQAPIPSERGTNDIESFVRARGALDQSQMNKATAPSESAQTHAAGRHAETPIVATDSGNAGVAGAMPNLRQSLLSRETLGHISLLLAVVWAVVASWLSLRLARGLFVIQRLRRSLQPTTDPRLIAAASQVASGGEPHVRVFESHLAPAPLTLGWPRSVIVMPEGLARLLDDKELESVLAHEAAHLARHDIAIAMLQQFSAIGFWWNPLLHVVNRQINQLRERICDAYVVRQFGDGLPLAQALVRVAEWSSCRDIAIPFASTLLDGEDGIENRIKRLTDRERPASIGLNTWSTSLLVLFGVMLAAVSLVPALRAQVVAAPVAKAAAPQTGWQVHIRAVDLAGEPIPNPRIGVQTGGKSERVWHNGGGDGSFTATIPTRTPRYCYLLVRADGYASMRALWRNKTEGSDDPLPSEFTFKMTKAITVGGTVVDQDNKPVSGATVLFSAGEYDLSRAQRAQASFSQEKYMTDEQGRWQCDLAPETINRASIRVSHPHLAIEGRSYGLDDQLAELRERKHRFTLQRGFVVTGRVVDEDGAPLEGATLVICELDAPSDGFPIEQTDADGRYRFERVAPHPFFVNYHDSNRFTLSIVKPGFAPAIQSVPGYGGRPLGDSTEQERIVHFTLSRGVPLTLHVVDSKNQPIKGTWVLPWNWRDTTALWSLQKFGIPRETDEHGVWKWNNAPVGETIHYDILTRGFADVRKHRIEIVDEAVNETIVLKRPQYLTGTVIDVTSRKPIAEFIVQQAFEKIAGNPDGLWWTSNHATRGRKGRYRMRVTSPPRTGSYTYRAIAEGYKPAVSKSIPFTNGETEVNFEMHPEKPRDDSDVNSDADKAKDDRETRLAKVEPEFRKIYQLNDKEVLRHVPEPLDRELRSKWYNAIFDGGGKDDQMEIVTLYVQWKDERPQWKGATVGFSEGGMPIRSVLTMLDAVSPQYIEGEAALLDQKIPGDWVFDPQATADEIVAAMRPVLRKEWGVPVTLEFRDVERDAYVVRGKWDFQPISDDFPDVQIYGTYLDKESGNGRGTGKFDKFLAKAGSWIEMPIINEIPESPAERFSWRHHMPSPFTQQQWDDAHNPEAVTANLAAQTGLEFVKERRKIRVLFVER